MENDNNQNGNFSSGRPDGADGADYTGNSTPGNAEGVGGAYNAGESAGAQNGTGSPNGADNAYGYTNPTGGTYSSGGAYPTGGANPYGNYGPGAYGSNPGYGNYGTPNQNPPYGQGQPQSSGDANSPYGQPNANQNPYAQYGGNVQYKWNYDDYQKALDKKVSDQSDKPKGNKRGLKPFLITVCSVVGVAVIGLAGYAVVMLASHGSAGDTGNSAGTTMQIQNQPTSSTAAPVSGKQMTVEQVATKVTPSVVGIEIYSVTSSSVEPTAEGTGIIMSSDGYILTNNHVVSGAQKIRVVLSNGKSYDKVKLVGTDSKTDLAVLKISATGLTAANFGNSSQLKVGQGVVAIGNPDGLTFASTVTNGIVSGLNRVVDTSSSATAVKYIQTNAAINPGNSGGPLINMYGQVVGINTAKISETGYEGLGFAIPIDTAKPIVDSIKKYGYVKGRVKLGISVYNLTSSQAQWYNYPSGLYVQSIESSCDAYSKGLRTKDIITKIDGISIASDDSDSIYNAFYKEESKHKPGETVTLTAYRPDTGNTFTISVKLEEDKGDSSTVTTSNSSNSDGSDGSSDYGSGNSNSNSNSNDNSNSFWSYFNQ